MPPPREGNATRSVLQTCAKVRVSFVVAIFSIGRPELVCQRTLAFLTAQGVAHSSIYVFTAPGFHASGTRPDVSLYRETLRSNGFENVNVVRGRKGLPQQINFINKFFDAGQYILFMSDTVRRCGLRHAHGSARKSALPFRGVHALMSLGQQQMRQTGALVWSVNCAQTFMSMGADVASLKFGGLNGNMFAMRAGALAKGLPSWCGLAFDYLLAALMFRAAGCILRFRFVGVENTYRMKGGHGTAMKGTRARLKAQRACCARICGMFPDLMSAARRPSAASSGCTLPIVTRPVGAQPVHLGALVDNKTGRPRRYFLDRPATVAERLRKLRARAGAKARPRLGAPGRKRVHFANRPATSTERVRAFRAKAQ